MTGNTWGLIAAAIAFVAILVLSSHFHQAPVAVSPPTPVSTHVERPKKTEKPVPEPEAKKPKSVKTKSGADCGFIPAIVRTYKKARVIAAAKEFGLSAATISALEACLN